MSNSAILMPMFVLVFYTFLVLISIPVSRFHAVAKKRVNPSYFKLNSGSDIPDYLVRINQHYENLLQMPILFYIVCVLFYLQSNLTSTIVILAWCYVATRAVHGLIHLTTNQVMHRFQSFLVSSIILVVLWIILFIKILSA